jgi:hypothetical protein
MTGKKTNKGFFGGTTDSTVLIVKNDSVVAIHFSKIGFIKTKRSAGHIILVTSLSLAVPLGLTIGAFATGVKSTRFNYSFGGGFAAGFLLGVYSGTLFGGAAAALRKVQTFKINGNRKDWTNQRVLIDKIFAIKIPAGN